MDREWEWDREREREGGRDRERALGFGGMDERERDRERLVSASAFRRLGLGAAPGVRYEAERPLLRRSQSMGSARPAENGEKKGGGELGGLPTAPPATSGSLMSSMQKAAFERNFPSLGAQERGGAGPVVQSNLGNACVLSPRPLWQGTSSPRLDGTGWSSALAEAPSSLTGNPPALNGTAIPIPSVSSSASSVAPSGTSSGTSMNAPKMAEALAQIPPRVRTPPQYSAEMQRLEELALKQSRQLIPMKPVLPKNMGLSPRDKMKPKAVRAADVVAPPAGMKQRQPMGSTQLLSSPYRPPAPQRPETPKPVQGGKILVRKSTKEVAPVLPSPPVSSTPRTDLSTGAPTLVGGSLGLTGPTSAVGGGKMVATMPRKQKQLLDRRAVPIPPISVSVGSSDGNMGSVRPKDGNSGIAAGTEDRRPPVQAQNRVDFFNAIRKRAAAGLGATPSTVDKPDVVTQRKSDIVNGKETGSTISEEGVVFPEEGGRNSQVGLLESENGDIQLSPSTKSDMPASIDQLYNNNEVKGKEIPSNGLILEGETDQHLFKQPETKSRVAPGGATASEEEEAAFLRSLGWEESTEGGEEALTEEEINAFYREVGYQERMRLMAISPAISNPSSHRLKETRGDLQVGSIGSLSSGLSSSDSESDDDCHACRP